MKYSLIIVALACFVATPALAEHEGKIQIMLLGDSTTEGSICRKHEPKGPHLEDVVRELLATEKELPPTNVINLGKDGEYIRRFLDSGRYDKLVPQHPGVDFILTRFGLNDNSHRKNMAEDYPKDYHELLERLKKDHPNATIIVMTVIPYLDEANSTRLNDLHREIAKNEGLRLFDIYPRYDAELKNGFNMLNYRRYPLDKIPATHREFVKQFTVAGDPAMVEVMDNRLDAHFGNLPGWYADRHPNLAGYHVIGDETAKYLVPLIREKMNAAKQ